MEDNHAVVLFICLPVLACTLIYLLLDYFCKERALQGSDSENEEFIQFNGGEDISMDDIFQAPSRVIARSSYATSQKALLARTNSLAILKLFNLACTLKIYDVVEKIKLLGSVRHTNLVPLYAFYVGKKGEMMMIHPFVADRTLSQLIEDGNMNWLNILKISMGIVKAIDFLHNAMEELIVHGNIKSYNIFIDDKYEPHVSDFGLHLMLNTIGVHEMIGTRDDQEYNALALELNESDYVSEKDDIYSIGIIFLKLITRLEAIGSSKDMSITGDPGHDVINLYHPEIVDGQTGVDPHKIKERVVDYINLALSCCVHVPSQRPDTKQILASLEEIAR